MTANWSLQYAGGVCQSVLNTCVLSNNVVQYNSGGAAQYSALTNCTLIGNVGYYGGGAHYCTLDNCVLTANQAAYGAGALGGLLNSCVLSSNQASQWGGGAYAATLISCLLITNSAGNLGGGAISCELDNCTLCGNSSGTGGGANSSTLNNCVAWFNASSNGANYSGCTFNYSCTTPDPGGGGNITNNPAFANAAAGDFHLGPGSPCINAGRNAYVAALMDLDGHPRIAGGTVDIGAYELTLPPSLLSYAWAQQYGFATDGSADFVDTDHDGMNNWQEWMAGTIPTNAGSVLKMITVSNMVSGITVFWQSVTNRSYFLQRSSNLAGQPTFSIIQTNIPGALGTTSFTDTTATNPASYFYRVGTQ